MKKYILLIMVLFSLPIFGQVRLSTMDSITTFAVYDYSYWNTLSGGAYLNRKVSWSALRTGMIDYIDGLANTWALKQTYSSGATFSSGANGTVTFGDSVVNTGTSNLNRIYPTTASTSQIGTVLVPYQNIWAMNFKLANTEGNDSVTINYDDSTLTFNKEVSIPTLNVTTSFAMDSAAALQSLKLVNNAYSISDVSDTVITPTALMSNIQLTLPGDVTKGIEKINMSGAAVGHIVLLYTTDIDDSVLFVDAASDGNLKMAGNLWLRTGDNIAFMYIYDQPAAGWFWMEIWRKDN